MQREEWSEYPKGRLKDLATSYACIMVDTVFLILWLLLQWGAKIAKDGILVSLDLSGLDAIELLVFQVLFFLTTLAPVAIYTYRDIAVVWLRAQKRVRLESLASKVGAIDDQSG